MIDIKILLTKILTALKVDYIVEQGIDSGWKYRKWNSGKVEAWYSYVGGSANYAVWVSPVRYRDITITIPSGIFTEKPSVVVATSDSNQLWVALCAATSETSISARFATVASAAITTTVSMYVAQV